MDYPGIVLLAPAQSGKTTAARYIARRYGFLHCGIAYPAKRAVGGLIKRWILADPTAADDDKDPLRHVDPLEACEIWKPEARPALQALCDTLHGVADRATIVRDIVRRQKLAGAPVVIDDARMPWETAAFIDAGWLVIRIYRPGAGVGDGSEGHVTEGRIDQCPYSLAIINDGTVDDLYALIDAALARRGIAPSPVDRFGAARGHADAALAAEMGDYLRYVG